MATIGCAAGMGLGWLTGQGFKWLKRGWDALPCAVNSFPADTLVHVKPDQAKAKDASLGKSTLKPIGDINPGDEVLAFAEWKDQGKSGKMDRRLSYEKVTDVYTSHKAQTLVRLTLDDGQTLTATEGHPFKTADGWRDAIMLKKGGKLLLKGGDGDADAERTATIAEVRTEQRTLPVYNLEVANGHTYFVGIDGELVHNGFCNKLGRAGKQSRLRNLATNDKLGSADRGWIKQELNSIERGQRDTIRNPPGKDLAHERGREAAKGFDYEHSNLQDRDLHRLQHAYDNYGRANRIRPIK